MCGIVALAGKTDLNLIVEMNNAISHRGPDDVGVLCPSEAPVALAMRRLSILDIEGGHQPMSNEDGSVWIVYNGEVFNSPELRAQLKNRHEFKSRNSDTEAILHLYEEQGEAMPAQLNGMFAFVIYDQRRNCLFASRDHTGIKPLYYYERAGSLALASELKSLLQLPDFDRQVDPQSLHHYLSLRYVPGQNTIFEGVHRLPPGHWLRYDLATGKLTIQQFWSLHHDPDPAPTVDEWVERIRAELRASVLRWTLSDVPIACSLSGGLDSSSVVALLAESGMQVRTYSLGFRGEDEEQFGELALARELAARWGTQHQEIVLEPDELLDDLISMTWSLDEPYGGGLPSWYVFRFMAQDVKVGLTGSGGDELFGNYRKYRLMEGSPLRRAAYAARRVQAMHGAKSPLQWPWADMVRHSVGALSNGQPSMRFYEHLYYSEAEKQRLLAGDGAGLVPTESFIQADASHQETANPRDRIQAFDFQNQLAEEFLFMTDRFSMAHSLEARVPFLDQRLIDLVRRIPASVRTSLGDPKYLLRRATADLLPSSISTNHRKRGFVIPTGNWLRGKLRPLVQRLLGPEYLQKQGMFNPDYYHHFVRPHLDGHVERGERIWPMLMFQMWYEVFIQQANRSAPTYGWRDLV